VTPATLGLHQPAGKPLLHERIQGRTGGICPKMLVQWIKALYKVACVQAKGQRTAGPHQDRGHEGAGNRTPNCNQAPAYIRGPGPLD
jgi:hypothetical protein